MSDNIDKNISGCLMGECTRMIKNIFDQRVRHLGVTRSQWLVLVNLGHEEGLTQAALAEIVEIEQPSLVRHIDNLENRKLLMRVKDDKDRRIKRIYLTEKGKLLIEKIEEEAVKLQSEFLCGISEQEQKAMQSFLAKMKANLSILKQKSKKKGD